MRIIIINEVVKDWHVIGDQWFGIATSAGNLTLSLEEGNDWLQRGFPVAPDWVR